MASDGQQRVAFQQELRFGWSQFTPSMNLSCADFALCKILWQSSCPHNVSGATSSLTLI